MTTHCIKILICQECDYKEVKNRYVRPEFFTESDHGTWEGRRIKAICHQCREAQEHIVKFVPEATLAVKS